MRTTSQQWTSSLLSMCPLFRGFTVHHYQYYSSDEVWVKANSETNHNLRIEFTNTSEEAMKLILLQKQPASTQERYPFSSNHSTSLMDRVILDVTEGHVNVATFLSTLDPTKGLNQILLVNHGSSSEQYRSILLFQGRNDVITLLRIS